MKTPSKNKKSRSPKANTAKPSSASAGTKAGWGRKIIFWAAVTCVWGVIGVTGLLAWYATGLPDVDEALAVTRRPSVTLLASDGSRLATVGDLYGVSLSLADVPPMLVQAVLATEDRRFYDHFGIDLRGLARSAWVNLRAARIKQGGSTITQQAAKNLFLTPERTLKRKLQEMMLAVWLEHKLTKDQILTVYLNRVYLGRGTYGVDAAARKYFGVAARDMTLYQSAMVAGLLKAPSRYNPHSDAKRADKRTRQVLANMTAAGYLSEADRAAVLARPRAALRTGGRGVQARYFVDWVLEQVSDFVTPAGRDLSVVTTLDPHRQGLAEDSIELALSKFKGKAGAPQGALVTLSPDGAVRAMVGGRNYRKSQYNRATQARRQPGSAFKPIIFLAGLEAGIPASSTFIDGPVTVDGWSPRNFARKHRGKMSMTQALAQSVNTVAVKVSERAGRRWVIQVARRLGITAPLTPHPSLALGVSEISLTELTGAYASFANGGFGVWAYGITEIKDASGDILYQRQGGGPGRVIDRRQAASINGMLAEAVRTGTGKAARFGRAIAGKTGTSQGNRDAWFIGYSADMVTGVWMGNDNEKSMKGVTGGGAPARLWRDYMAAAHKGMPQHELAGVSGPPVPVKATTNRKTLAPVKASKAQPEKPGFWGSLMQGIFGEDNAGSEAQ